jgi:hypothetical protein
MVCTHQGLPRRTDEAEQQLPQPPDRPVPHLRTGARHLDIHHTANASGWESPTVPLMIAALLIVHTHRQQAVVGVGQQRGQDLGCVHNGR